MNKNKKLLIYYIVTTIGSALSSYASFLSIESHFGSIQYLSLGLSLKTVGIIIFSLINPYIIIRSGFKKTFLYSQVVGILSVGLLALGFANHSSSLTMTGLILTSFPGSIVLVALLTTFKLTSDSDTEYRKLTSTREALVALTQIFCAFLTPLLLKMMSIYHVFLVNVITYILALAIASKINISAQPFIQLPSKESSKFARINFIKFCSRITPAFILAAFIPLLASSAEINFSMLNTDLKKSLWSIEAFVGFTASYIYLYLNQKSFNRLPYLAFNFSAATLLIAALFENSHTYLIPVFLIPASFSIQFLKQRDDMIISLGSNEKLITHYTSYAVLYKSILQSVSPFIIASIFANHTLTSGALYLTLIQLMCICVGYITIKIVNKYI